MNLNLLLFVKKSIKIISAIVGFLLMFCFYIVSIAELASKFNLSERGVFILSLSLYGFLAIFIFSYFLNKSVDLKLGVKKESIKSLVKSFVNGTVRLSKSLLLLFGLILILITTISLFYITLSSITAIGLIIILLILILLKD